MDRTDANPAVAVMGAGAVGSYFGGMLARAGVPVTLIGRSAHVQAIAQDGLDLDTVSFRQRVPIDATTEAAAVSRAGIVLFCVKSIDNEPASRAIAPHLSPRAIVVSLQNGVDNVDRIYAASGIHALPAVVYVASALPYPGHVKHSGRGELVVGELRNPTADRRASALDPDRCQQVTELFTGAGVPCRISTDIEADLWSKFVMNCAANAVGAIGQTTYGAAVREEHTREVMVCLIEETIAVARASGVRLPPVDFVEAGLKFVESIGYATSSTAQDIARGKRTEIDSLNGFIVHRGAQLGVPTPVSFTVHALVKLLEAKNASTVTPAG